MNICITFPSNLVRLAESFCGIDMQEHEPGGFRLAQQILRMSKHKLQLAIYLSGILLSGSVFLPLATFPVYGDASYYRIAEIEAWLVIVFSMTAPGLMLYGKEKLAILSPLAVWGILLYPTLRNTLESTNNSLLNQLGNGVSTTMSDFAANLFFNISDYHWGGFVFLFALLAFSACNIFYRLKA
jgi:hypothetical protein